MAQERGPQNLIVQKRLELAAVRKLVRQGRLSPDIGERKEAAFRELVGETQLVQVLPEPTSETPPVIEAPKVEEVVPSEEKAPEIPLERLLEIRFSSKEQLIIDRLCSGSLKNPVSFRDLANDLYRELPSESLRMQRIGGIVRVVRGKLKNIGLNVICVPPVGGTRSRQEGRYYLVFVKEEAIVTKPEEKERQLPLIVMYSTSRMATIDGRGIRIYGKVAWEVLNLLALHVQEEVHSKKVAEIARKAGSKSQFPANDAIETLRIKIEPDPKNPQIIIRLGQSGDSKYRLDAQVEFHPESKERLPRLVVDREKQEVSLGTRTIQILSPIQWAVFEYLCRLPNDAISFRQIEQIAKREGYKGGYPAGNIINQLRIKIEPDPKNPQIIIHLGSRETSEYYLNAQVDFIGVQEKPREEEQTIISGSKMVKSGMESHEIFDIPLFDGMIVARIRGKVRARALEILKDHISEDKAIQSDVFTKLLYGQYDEKHVKNLVDVIRRLKNDLQPLGVTIVQSVSLGERAKGQKGKYYLEKIGEEAPVEEAPRTPEVKSTEEIVEPVTAISPPAVTLPEETVIEEMPYVKSEEEMRTKEETKILKSIVSQLTQDPRHPRISYDAIHADLAEEIQNKKTRPVLGGKRKYPVYQSIELQDKFESAARKLRQEASIAREREAWGDDERYLWQQIELLVDEFGGRDFDEFLRKAKILITRSQREFYQTYPRREGRGPVDYIEA